MTEPKIVIAGTGRAGTTLLVQILTDLGFDTGFAPGVQANPEARAGLEKNILAPGAPRVVKSPKLSMELEPLLEQGLVVIEHVIIPVRDLDVAAASRIRASGYGRSLNAQGGLLWGAKRASRQRSAVAEILAQLMVTVAKYDLAHTLLAFPRFATDADYTFRKLSALDPSVGVEQYRTVIAQRYRPDYVHEKPLDAGEARKATFNEPIALAKRAVAGVKARVSPSGRTGNDPARR